jgi:hypothetical protein
MKIINLIYCVDVILQSAVSYTYIGSMPYLFELDMTKSLLNKLNLKSYSDSICSGKIRYSDLANQIDRFFFCFLLDFLLS